MSQLEFCHYRDDANNGHWCGRDAEFIVWGKLFPLDALGPRCYDHAAEQVGHRTLGDSACAIFDLRPLTHP